ncbi:hypothetical protein Tco_0466054 [Tanacetum coccineum]
MSRDVITVGSTMRIPLLYRGEYSQWRERFMNFLEEQTDGEAMINSIWNGDHPLPTAEEKKNRKIDCLAISLLIQGLPNDIYSLIDRNDTAKDLWDALKRQMHGEQDRKAAILYEYETFKATEGEQLIDTYLRCLQVINDLKKCGYKKNNCELNYKFLNNLQLEWKQYGTLMRQTKNLMDINIDALYNILKQNQGDVNDVMRYKKKSCCDILAKEDYSERSKLKDYNYYKTKMLLAKKDSDEQVLLAEDQSWMGFSSDSDQEINANMVFMAKMEKVLLDSEESSSSAEETIAEVSYYTSDSESESEYETSEYYDNSINYGLFVDNDDEQEFFHDAIEFASENFNENHIVSQIDHDQSEVDHNDSEEKEHLVDKLIMKFNQKIAKSQKRIEKANQQSQDLENQNEDLQDKYDVLKNQVNTFEEKNNEFNEQIKVLNETNVDLVAQTEVLQEKLKVKHVLIDTHTECQAQYAKLEKERYQYMIRYSALCDNDKQHRKKIDEQEILFVKIFVTVSFENPSYFCKAKDLRPSLYDERVIGLGYTPMLLTHSDGALEIEKFKKARDNKIKFAYDYGNLNASYVNEKINFLDDYFQEIINPDFEKIDSLFQQTSSLKPYTPTVILEKIIIDLEDEVVSLLEKEKENLEIIESLKSKGSESSANAISESENQSEHDCHVVEKGCDNLENSKVIARGMFKINVSQSVSPISAYKRLVLQIMLKIKQQEKHGVSSFFLPVAFRIVLA